MPRRFLSISTFGLALCTVAAPGAAFADVVDLVPVKDACIYNDPFDIRANGAGTTFFAGSNGQGDATRALIQFSFAAIPAGSTINSVSLRLRMSRTMAPTSICSLHQLTTAWNEGPGVPVGGGGGGGDGGPALPGDSTWAHTNFPGSFWSTPGGDFDPAASASQSVGGAAFYTWASTAALVADVQGWLDSPATNLGWILVGNEIDVPGAKRFDGRTHGTVNNRPKLTVDYTLGSPCACDFDAVPGTQVPDIFAFLALWFASDPAANFDADPAIGVPDIFGFLACWFAGCP